MHHQPQSPPPPPPPGEKGREGSKRWAEAAAAAAAAADAVVVCERHSEWLHAPRVRKEEEGKLGAKRKEDVAEQKEARGRCVREMLYNTRRKRKGEGFDKQG